MKFANDIKKKKELRKQHLQKEHIERVNEELLEIEKAQNTYETDDSNYNSYIDIPMIIKTQEAKDSLKEHGFFIDKINQDIPYGTTRVYLDESSFQIATNKKVYKNLTDSCLKNDKEKELNKDDVLKIAKILASKCHPVNQEEYLKAFDYLNSNDFKIKGWCN